MFKRTPGGLSSQRIFYGAELIAYIEGKTTSNQGVIYDTYYYSALFNEIFKGKTVKIKVLGCSNDVVKMHDDIVENNITDSFSIVDRDYHGIVYSRLPDFRLIMTYGYSWENDFWTPLLCQEVLSLLTMNSEAAILQFIKELSKSEKRLTKAHQANLSCKANGFPLFILGKKGGEDGISINHKGIPFISRAELSKFILKIRNSSLRGDFKKTMSLFEFDSYRLIQGHYWEYLVLNMLNVLAKKHSLGRSTAPHDTIKNLAFSRFQNSAVKFLSDKAMSHYRSSFEPFI